MSAKFYTLLTDIGAAKLVSAAALGVPLKITHMAVGSGGGMLPTPNAQQTALVAEERRAALNMLYIDPQNSSQIIAEQVIPENEGGWWIREVGLFDETGALIAVGNCPESYKPKLAEGSGRTQTVRMVLITSSTDNITLKIDPAVVLATRKYVDDKVLELKVYVDDLMAKHLAAVDPHSQYAPKDSPTLTGMPKTPTPPAGNNSTLIASTAFVQAAILALIGGAPATLDTLKEIAAAINNDPNFSTTINNALALKAPLASPALTGTPTAPTAAQTVNNTQIATTAFVKAAIAGLVGSSPEALDTLNELAAALGNDPNFATTVMNALAGKQPLDATLTNLSGKSVSALLQYLGLGEAAKRNVGNGENQIPDMSFWTVTGGNGNFVIRQPDGLIIQMVTVSISGPVAMNGMTDNAYAITGSNKSYIATATLPFVFPNKVLGVIPLVSTTAYGGVSSNITGSYATAVCSFAAVRGNNTIVFKVDKPLNAAFPSDTSVSALIIGR
ncbi:phage tail protein [Escherichia coli]|uniref:phage tail protein n=1 Tax=Escherichia coli TaxID=562 RepID=UPI0010CBDE18|nr:phage tail protein [Escherichia coli]EKM8739213.1 phage tail protein [Escherichia coli]MBF9114026.1 phage tail protein [Escherichia coli]MCG0306772.1 phage tail protein [Escherichia coli]MDC3504970.1 phage tail protein [Escherichia coli]QOH82541.1 phage tail protein [Escherichia coli]